MLMTRRLFIMLLLTMLSGCATLKVHVDYDPSANFTGLKTYDWISGSQVASEDPRFNDNPFIETLIRRTLKAQLGIKGYVQESSDTPDFLVGYYATMDERIDITRVDRYYGYSTVGRSWEGYGYEYETYGWAAKPEIRVKKYKEGTLIVDIVNSETRSLMWRGVVQDEMSFSQQLEEKEEKLNDAVNRMLKEFPPK
jgi:opacity protein-like surface antigen